MDEFEKELKIGFLQEATQLLTDTEQCFLNLETAPGDKAILEQIFRLAHNLKGSSKAVGFDAMGAFTHEFESFLLKIKNGEIAPSTASLNLLLRCNDHLKTMVGALTENLEAIIDSAALTEEVKRAQNGQFDEAEEPVPAEPALAETSPSEAAEEEISPHELHLLLAAETKARVTLESEASLKIEVPNLAPPNASAPPAPPAPPAEDSIRVSIARLEKLLNLVGEMVILQSVLREQSQGTNSTPLRKAVHQLGKVTKEVQDISMALRMVPVKTTFQKMQRIVRDTAQALGKKVTLHVTGEETELDKTVLEYLGDPLVHIIRNSVDHGIESAEKRRAAGKPEGGTVRLSAYHQSGRLVIEIVDDGGGIPTKVLIAKAIEKGILKPGATLSEKEAVNLIFHPGFSTKAQVTEVSGRGVGMDVVRTNIEKLRGEIQIETALGVGTTMKIFLPLTLAIIDGMVVRSGEERYVLPLAHVHESLKPGPNDVQFRSGLGEILILRGENLPLFRLEKLLGLKSSVKTGAPAEGIAIVVRAAGRPFAVIVDDIIGQNQIVIKRLGPEVAHLKGFGGSAILGDGRPSLILELSELAQKANADPRRVSPPLGKIA